MSGIFLRIWSDLFSAGLKAGVIVCAGPTALGLVIKA